MNSWQCEQYVGCLKKRAMNLWPLTWWIFLRLSAPRRCGATLDSTKARSAEGSVSKWGAGMSMRTRVGLLEGNLEADLAGRLKIEPERLGALGAGDKVREGHGHAGNEAAAPDKFLVEDADLQIAAAMRGGRDVLVPARLCGAVSRVGCWRTARWQSQRCAPVVLDLAEVS